MKETKQGGTPTWVWLIAGLGLITFLGVCVVIVAAVAIFFIADSNTTVVLEPTLAVVEVMPEELTPTIPPTDMSPSSATDTPQATEPTDTPPAEPPGETPTSEPAGEADDPNAELRTEIEGNVAEIRGLEPQEPVVTTLLTSDELRTRVEEDLFAELTEEDAADFTLILHAFDFVDRDFDYYNFTLDLYSEQIAGFYDPETDEFVVVSEDDNLDVTEQWTHAHEFMHALQDQYFALDMIDDETLDSEASAALLALVEGEAVLVQNLYLLEGYFTFEQLNELLELSLNQDSPVFDSAPPVLANNLIFPYTAGYEFTQYLYNQDGFDALDSAWANPPTSTEQILHPEKYLAGDTPQLVALAPLTDTLGVDWQQLDEDVFGEFFLNEYLIQQLPESEADAAAEGWGGDRYAVYYNESTDGLVMTLRLVWDTPADASEFTTAYTDYLNALYGTAGAPQADGGVCWQGADVSCLYQDDSGTFIVRAPDLAIAQAVAAIQP